MANSVRFGELLLGCITCAWLVACSDECPRGTTECLSNSMIRSCVPGEDSNEWLVSQCGPSETCLTNPSLVIRSSYLGGEQDAGVSIARPDKALLPTEPACVGKCQLGDHECVSDGLARFCVGEGVWQLDPCGIGKKCTAGVCALGQLSGAVQACKPNSKACASDRIAKLCDPDGSGWVEQPCADNEACIDDQCKPDPNGSCDKGNSCLDSQTAIRCLGHGKGFALQECKGDSYCESGRCRGAVCVTGKTCLASNQLRECVDGSSYKDTQCGVNEICEADGDTASCVPLQCSPGVSACGDPRDASVDKTKFFTSCVNGANGVPAWVKGECTGQATCDPSLATTGMPCSQECSVGAQRCAGDPVSGIVEGFQTCGKNAKWGATENCNKGAEQALSCAIARDLDASHLPKAICAAPICAWLLSNPSAGATGACDGEQILTCQPDGTLADASTCETGVCRTLRNTVTADGLMPAACGTTSDCQADEEICVDANGSATPRYRSCFQDRWSVELKTCAKDAQCHTTKDDKGLRHVLCGVQCTPGERRCNDVGDIDECDDGGHFNTTTACSAGVCRMLGSHDAACVLECIPGDFVCAGATTLAADGYHTGTTQQIRCGSDGRKAAAQDCPAGNSCRVTSTGVTLGCVECVGPSAPGGNADSATDSRCDAMDAAKLQECGDDNHWTASRMCAGTKQCLAPVMPSCGSCMGAGGRSLTCSQAALADDTAGTTCEGLSFGAPSAWAGVSDCCAKYQLGTSSFAYCK